MNITVIGTGYVGLVSGACFAEVGNHVTCVDVDEAKIGRLKAGEMPIYEPGIGSLVVENHKAGRLRFTTSLPVALTDADVLFVAVGTPPGADGSADLTHILAVSREIGRHLTRYVVVVDKSTVPVGTAEKVRAAIQNELQLRNAVVDFDVVSNPEFLKEGAAVADFMRPDRIIVGIDNERPRGLMEELYRPFNRNHERVVFMGLRDAEMTKYAANAMLATKISFMNEIAGICERLGVDVENVRKGIGADQRIGYHFIYPGCGYGGSCFPKDVKALVKTAGDEAFDPILLKSVEERNRRQKSVLYEKLEAKFGAEFTNRTVAVWGLAFKPGTDDMREAPSLVLIRRLLQAGAAVRVHDPIATNNAMAELADHLPNERLQFLEDQYEAAIGADALVLVTEWKPYRNPDFDLLRKTMRQPVIIDGRNQYEPASVRSAGFQYVGIGR